MVMEDKFSYDIPNFLVTLLSFLCCFTSFPGIDRGITNKWASGLILE